MSVHTWSNIWIVLGSITLTLGAVIVSAWLKGPPQPIPLETTPRLLDCEPDFFANRLVRVRNDGMQSGANANEIVFRKISDQPPLVLCRFRSDLSGIPPFATGRCLGRQNGVVLVVDCR